MPYRDHKWNLPPNDDFFPHADSAGGDRVPFQRSFSGHGGKGAFFPALIAPQGNGGLRMQDQHVILFAVVRANRLDRIRAVSGLREV